MNNTHVWGSNTYFKNHIWYKSRNVIDEKNIHMQFMYEIWKFLPTNKNTTILDIWYGQWYFSTYMNSMWYKNYTWVDIDNTYQNELEKNMPHYTFHHQDVFDFFNTNTTQYNIIFPSNIFEHLGKEERIVRINKMNHFLQEGGMRINYMPNADSILWATGSRYTDITHYSLYNYISFSQLLHEHGNFSTISHYNQYIWNTIFKRILHKTAIWITKIIYTILWFSFPKTYTWQIITICKK